MKILFTFPGQGGQRPGMLAMIPDREAILTQARAVLGDEVATLDSADALQHTRAVQLCLLIAGVAWARELQRPVHRRVSGRGDCRRARFRQRVAAGGPARGLNGTGVS